MVNKEKIQSQKWQFFSGRLMTLLVLFKDALYEAVKQPMRAKYGEEWESAVLEEYNSDPYIETKSKNIQDPQTLLKILVFLDCNENGLNRAFAEFYSINRKEYAEKVHSAIKARNTIVHGLEGSQGTRNIRSMYYQMDDVLRPLRLAGGNEYRARYQAFAGTYNTSISAILKSNRYCTVAELLDNSRGIGEDQIRSFFRNIKALEGDVVLNYGATDALKLLFENISGDTGYEQPKEETPLEAEERILASESISEKVALARGYLENGHRVEVAKAIVLEACKMGNPEALFLKACYLANTEEERKQLLRKAASGGDTSAIEELCKLAYNRDHQELFWAVQKAQEIGYSCFLLVALFLNVSLSQSYLFDYLKCKKMLDSFTDPEYAEEMAYYRSCLEVKASDNPARAAISCLEKLSEDGNPYARAQRALYYLSQMNITEAERYPLGTASYPCLLSDSFGFSYGIKAGGNQEERIDFAEWSKNPQGYENKYRAGIGDYDLNDYRILSKDVLAYRLDVGGQTQHQFADTVARQLIEEYNTAGRVPSAQQVGQTFGFVGKMMEPLYREYYGDFIEKAYSAKPKISTDQLVKTITIKYDKDTMLPMREEFDIVDCVSMKAIIAMRACGIMDQLMDARQQYSNMPFGFLLRPLAGGGNIPLPVLESITSGFAELDNRWKDRVGWFKELDRQAGFSTKPKENAAYQAMYYRQRAEKIILQGWLDLNDISEAVRFYIAARECGEDVPDNVIPCLNEVKEELVARIKDQAQTLQKAIEEVKKKNLPPKKGFKDRPLVEKILILAAVFAVAFNALVFLAALFK